MTSKTGAGQCVLRSKYSFSPLFNFLPLFNVKMGKYRENMQHNSSSINLFQCGVMPLPLGFWGGRTGFIAKEYLGRDLASCVGWVGGGEEEEEEESRSTASVPFTN